MPRLSIIILSYNTKDITLKCLESLNKSLADIEAEIIVVDNGSKDGTKEMLLKIRNSKSEIRNNNVQVKTIFNEKNLGYPRGNNQALAEVKGKYILFLNSDVTINNVDFKEILTYLDQHQDIGVLTVKVMLLNGKIDPASHRGFPNIWNAFCYFAQLEKLFGKIPLLNHIFGGYHLTYCHLTSIHEIDSPSGAFYLTRKSILDKVGGFDENFFIYGEDLDLSFRIKAEGYKIIYYPVFQVTHLKYSSGLKRKNQETFKSTRKHFYEAMKIFYQKHYADNMPAFINKFIYFSIDLKRKLS